MKTRRNQNFYAATFAPEDVVCSDRSKWITPGVHNNSGVRIDWRGASNPLNGTLRLLLLFPFSNEVFTTAGNECFCRLRCETNADTASPTPEETRQEKVVLGLM